MNKSIQSLRLKLKVALASTLISYALLLLVIAVNNIVRADGSIKYWLLQSIPLLIFVPGIIKRHFRTYSWMCFVILIYFIHYADKLSTDPGSIINWLAITLTVVLFNGAMMTSRWMQYWSIDSNNPNNINTSETADNNDTGVQ